MILYENHLFDYMFCPAKYEMKYIKKIDIKEPNTLPMLLNKVSSYFFTKLLDGKVCSINELKSKWDSICDQNLDYIDSKKTIEGYSYILNFLNWAHKEKLYIIDMNTKYSILANDIELVGNIRPILLNKDLGYEILDLNFSSKLPDQIDIDTKLKYTIDSFAYQSIYNRELDGIKIHSVKHNRDYFTRRNNTDYKRLKSTIIGVYNGLKNGAFYPREQILCSSCTAKHYCKYWHTKND